MRGFEDNSKHQPTLTHLYTTCTYSHGVHTHYLKIYILNVILLKTICYFMKNRNEINRTMLVQFSLFYFGNFTFVPIPSPVASVKKFTPNFASSFLACMKLWIPMNSLNSSLGVRRRRYTQGI